MGIVASEPGPIPPDRPAGKTAAFDFDGTLTRRDTLLPFLVHVAGRRAVGRALAARAGPLALALGGRGDRGVQKEQVLGRLLAGWPLAELEAVADEFAEAAVATRLRPEVVGHLRAHLAAGDLVVVVTASPELVVAPIARRLGPVPVVGTRLEVGADGRLTGGLLGANVRGAEKVRRLTEWLGDGTLHWAYGDSAGDREMLAAAAVPTWVGRRPSGPR
ncbi:MAG: HAD family hydrolase [Acidimicrobiales bacterium]